MILTMLGSVGYVGNMRRGPGVFQIYSQGQIIQMSQQWDRGDERGEGVGTTYIRT
jgi:hypothetical protein